MDPQVFSILMPLNKMIDELRKQFAKENAKQQLRSNTTIDEKFDIGELKATKATLMKEVEIMRDNGLKARESFYALQGCLLKLCRIASPNTSPQNVQLAFYLPLLLMKEELGNKIADEKVTRFAQASRAVVPENADEVTNIDDLKSEIVTLRSVLELLDNEWMSMCAAFHAFVKMLTNIGLIVAPGEVSPLQRSSIVLLFFTAWLWSYFGKCY